MIASRTLFIALCFTCRILTAFGGVASYTTILSFVGQEFTTNYAIVFVCTIYPLLTLSPPPPYLLSYLTDSYCHGIKLVNCLPIAYSAKCHALTLEALRGGQIDPPP